MKPITKFTLTALVAAALSPAAVLAQTSMQTAGNEGFLINTSAAQVVKSGTGLCWHTTEWKPGTADACNPAPAPVAVAPAPAPVIAAAAPPPVMVVQAPPPKPMPQKISFSADALFDFDKAVLKPQGRVALDGFVHQLDGADYSRIAVTGHTDRFGTVPYNQKLSERRARAVKDYLVSRSIVASSVDADGKGKMEPVTKAGDCLGPKSRKVVACLQPDRRVDIAMSGTKTVASSK